MKIADPSVTVFREEREVFDSMLPLQGAHILELGCGKAEKTRSIAQGGKVARIMALEVDQIQHAKNLQIADLPNVTFSLGGAEAIPASDNSFDIVIMFKSLHHVPMEVMDQALAEIARVLKPGGVAYISEPVYAGDFNELLRLFHDEKIVREAAFAAISRAVESGKLVLVEQKFFNSRNHFDSFDQFDQRIIKVTHTQHRLSAEIYDAVREKFMRHMTPQGANFTTPIRVDLLRKPSLAA
jgi:ubiquinone/menaquinone biosynthesis C-methylase UbiE